MPKSPWLLIALCALLIAPDLRADELKLKNGGKFQGKLISRAHGKVHFKAVHGVAVFLESEVDRVIAGPSPWERYAQRRANHSKRDVAARLDLARWCKRQGLRKEMHSELLAVLKVDPNQGEARKLRREMKVHGIWLPETVARRVLGQVRHRGRWRDAKELAAEKAGREAQRQLRELKRKVDGLLARLVKRSSKTRAKARGELDAIATAKKLPKLRAYTASVARAADEYWSAVATGIIEVRLQQAQLVGLRRRTLSLGTGSPVTIELPEVRSVRIGTTVGVPLGIR